MIPVLDLRIAKFYMNVARQCAEMSRAIRLKVGSVVVKNNNIISFSWNGMPAGWDNNCEDRIYNTKFKEQVEGGKWIDPDTYKVVDIEDHYPFIDENEQRYCLKTKPEVLHAERNALDKLVKTGIMGGEGAVLFTTHSPCLECAKSIYGSGIKKVYFGEQYRDTAGLDFLHQCNIEIEQLNV